MTDIIRLTLFLLRFGTLSVLLTLVFADLAKTACLLKSAENNLRRNTTKRSKHIDQDSRHTEETNLTAQDMLAFKSTSLNLLFLGDRNG